MQEQTKTTVARERSAKPSEPLLLDIRQMFARGISPCGSIDQAVASLKPNQEFILVAPFEPVPLFTKLAAQGFEHASEAMPDGSWQIRFVRTGGAVSSGASVPSCCS